MPPGEIESSPGSSANLASGETAPTTAPLMDSVPASGGLADVAPSSDSPFSLNDSVMFSDNLDETVSVPGGDAPVEGAPETPAQAAPTATPTPATPPTPGQAPALETTPAEVAPQVQPTPTPQAPQGPQSAPEQLLGELSKNRDALISNLAETRFKLSKEESDLLEVDVHSAIQRISARVYYEAATTTLNQIQRLVPQLIEQSVTAAKVYSDAETAFFKAWPALNDKEHGAVINQYANIFRAANPRANQEDTIAKVGAIVMAILGNPVAPQRANGNGATPAARPKPFTPASGAARVVAQTPISDNPFDGLGKDFE